MTFSAVTISPCSVARCSATGESPPAPAAASRPTSSQARVVDHWITEYWDDVQARWIRIDSEILEQATSAHPHDLRPGDFLTGGEAWSAFRRGEIDASQFGVYGTQNWGPSEIRGNAVRDLAALNKIETLPWDEWGRMTDAYAGRTSADYDSLLDELASVCASSDPDALS